MVNYERRFLHQRFENLVRCCCRTVVWAIGGAVLATGGCHSTADNMADLGQVDPAQAQQRLVRMLAKLPTVKSVRPWPLPEVIGDHSTGGLEITTRHYRIYSTLRDPLILRQVPVFLESAFRSYSTVVGETIVGDKKLLIYFFGNRGQWEDFSQYWTGKLAPIYLKIKAGAYYLNGACVAYHIGRESNFSVLAHEGWHQFADELLVFRLPAWLDEGLATNFEAYRWKNGRVEFVPRHNGSRLWSLGQTIARDNCIPLLHLLMLDAGRVLSHSGHDPDSPQADPMVAAYYAQVYALVRFLREDDYGRRLQAFHTMVDNGYRGRWQLTAEDRAEATQRQRNPTRRWNARVGPLIFRQYIGPLPSEIENDYRAFCRKIVTKVRFKKKR